MTRDLTSPMAAQLRSSGVELVRADYDDPESLSTAMSGTYGVFSVQNFWEGGAEKEIRQAGFQADIVANKKNYPEVRPLTLEQLEPLE